MARAGSMTTCEGTMATQRAKPVHRKGTQALFMRDILASNSRTTVACEPHARMEGKDKDRGEHVDIGNDAERDDDDEPEHNM